MTADRVPFISPNSFDHKDTTMFTGIIEQVGQLVASQAATPTQTAQALPHDQGQDSTNEQSTAQDQDFAHNIELRFHSSLAAASAQLGDSIAVDGVCLTVTDLPGNDTFAVDVMPETLRHTALGRLEVGSPVNIERAMPTGGRLDGHIVQGHVDGVGHLSGRVDGDRWVDLTFQIPRELAKYVATKGSIAVSGTSLTVTHVGPDSFGVSLIPTTLEHTTLGGLKVGAPVNLEVDVIAKYVERLASINKAAPHPPATSAEPTPPAAPGAITGPGPERAANNDGDAIHTPTNQATEDAALEFAALNALRAGRPPCAP